MEKRDKRRVLGTLFTSMMTISAFTFGGGFVIVTLMKKRFVDELSYLSEQEMLDMTALAQSSPGPIAVNAAILVGSRVAGAAGVAAAVLGTIIPPMGILSLISLCYAAFAENPYVALVLKGMQSGVAAVILDVTLSMGEKVVRSGSALRMAIMLGAFVAVCFFEVNVIAIIAAAALLGAVSALAMRRKGAKE